MGDSSRRCLFSGFWVQGLWMRMSSGRGWLGPSPISDPLPTELAIDAGFEVLKLILLYLLSKFTQDAFYD